MSINKVEGKFFLKIETEHGKTVIPSDIEPMVVGSMFEHNGEGSCYQDSSQKTFFIIIQECKPIIVCKDEIWVYTNGKSRDEVLVTAYECSALPREAMHSTAEPAQG